jgi:hypothetical protein
MITSLWLDDEIYFRTKCCLIKCHIAIDIYRHRKVFSELIKKFESWLVISLQIGFIIMVAENKLKFIHNTIGILDIYENTVSAVFYHYQNMHQDKHRVFNVWLDNN